MTDLKTNHQNKLKEIFSLVEYKNVLLESDYISIGKLPGFITDPHINIQWQSQQRTPEFVGGGDKITNIYKLDFIKKPSNPIDQLNETNLEYITNSLNDFSTTFMNYFFENGFRFGAENTPWYSANQTGQSELKKLESNSFYISIILEIINY